MTHTPLPPGSRIAVIGAGIIGSSAAFALRERGYEVTLFDRDEPGRTGPSFGNAGHIAGQGIFPLATPGIGLKGMRMLLDPDAPLKIPPAYAAQISPWLWAFWRSSYGAAQEASIKALTMIAQGTLDETERLWTRAGFAQLLTRQPALYLYDTEVSYQLDQPHWQERVRLGFSSSPVDAPAIRELEPALAPIFPRGMLSHDYGHVTDPFEIISAMFRAGQERGVGYERAKVDAVRDDASGAVIVIDGAERKFDAVLISAGAWSKPLAASLGENLPVEAERGYNLTYAGAKGTLRHPLLLADRGLAVTPLAIGLRFGGWTELGGVRLPPNPDRWRKIRGIADKVIPSLAGAEAREWMGHRPSMPDTVPAISRSTKTPRVFYAVGHGHYGLSYSAKTARFVTELIADAADERLAPFAMSRFN
jgi:D-amino-acid dehydrogenase